MTNKKKPLPDDREQSERFLETAKKLGVDETGAAFKRALPLVVPPVKKKK